MVGCVQTATIKLTANSEAQALLGVLVHLFDCLLVLFQFGVITHEVAIEETDSCIGNP